MDPSRVSPFYKPTIFSLAWNRGIRLSHIRNRLTADCQLAIHLQCGSCLLGSMVVSITNKIRIPLNLELVGDLAVHLPRSTCTDQLTNQAPHLAFELHILTVMLTGLRLLDKGREEYGFGQKGALTIRGQPQELQKILHRGGGMTVAALPVCHVMLRSSTVSSMYSLRNTWLGHFLRSWTMTTIRDFWFVDIMRESHS